MRLVDIGGAMPHLVSLMIAFCFSRILLIIYVATDRQNLAQRITYILAIYVFHYS